MYSNYRTYVSSRILNRSTFMPGGCIEYAKTKHIYGLVSITIDGHRKSVPAHRAMWMACNDKFDLPRYIVIRHKCDNPRCVNIEHLEMGTHKDNIQDALDRGRRGHGTKKYKLHTRQRVLDDQTIKYIKNEPETMKHRLIAAKYGISVGYVSKLRSGKAKTLI